MADFDNTNTMTLFRNDKGDNPKRPDYRGKANFFGVDCKTSSWIKESKKDGSKFLSGPIEVEDADLGAYLAKEIPRLIEAFNGPEPSKAAKPAPRNTRAADLDEPIPF